MASDGEMHSVVAEICRQAPEELLAEGQRVVISGLQRSPELNCCVGTTVSFHRDCDRWGVALPDGNGKAVKVKTCNLRSSQSVTLQLALLLDEFWVDGGAHDSDFDLYIRYSVKILEFEPSFGMGCVWSNLANNLHFKGRNGAVVGGTRYINRDMVIKALELDPTSMRSWNTLRCVMCTVAIEDELLPEADDYVTMRGCKYDFMETCKQIVATFPDFAGVEQEWHGVMSDALVSIALQLPPGGKTKVGRLASEVSGIELIVEALQLDPGMAQHWTVLGTMLQRGLTVTVRSGLRGSPVMYDCALCFSKALSLDPPDRKAWYRAPSQGQPIRVRGQEFSVVECCIEAVKEFPRLPSAWRQLGATCRWFLRPTVDIDLHTYNIDEIFAKAVALEAADDDEIVCEDDAQQNNLLAAEAQGYREAGIPFPEEVQEAVMNANKRGGCVVCLAEEAIWVHDANKKESSEAYDDVALRIAIAESLSDGGGNHSEEGFALTSAPRHLACCTSCRRKIVHSELVRMQRLPDTASGRRSVTARQLKNTQVPCPVCREVGKFVPKSDVSPEDLHICIDFAAHDSA